MTSILENVEKTCYLIFIEGNIASGKTTLLANFMNKYAADEDIKFIPIFEPVQRFEKYQFGNYNPLSLAYDDPIQNLPCTQLHITKEINLEFDKIMQQVLHMVENISQSKIVLLQERSLFSPIMFLNSAWLNGYINNFTCEYLCEHAIQCARGSLSKARMNYAGGYFLNTKPEECLQRLKTRNRLYETKLNLNNMQTMDFSAMRHLEEFWHGNYPGLIYSFGESNIRDLRNFISTIITSNHTSKTII